MNDESNAPDKETKPLKKKILIVFAAIFMVLACIGGLYYYFDASSYVSTDDAFIEGHVISVSPRISGHILKVFVDDNQHVKEGELLARLDPRDYEVRYKMAQAGLEAARAKATQADEDLNRYKGLTVNDTVSKQEMEHVLAASRIADAESEKAKAALEQAKLELSYTDIYAPAAGRVTEKSVEEGAFVQVGQTLLTIVTEERWVIANFKETDLKDILPGQPVTVEIDAYPGKVFKGRVDSIQRGTGARFSLLPAENATGNYVKVVQRVPVKILFDENPDSEHPIALGMSVVPKVWIKKQEYYGSRQ